MEQVEDCSFIVDVGNGRQLVIDTVHVIHMLVVANIPAPCATVRIQHSKISVKAAVLLQHKDDVVHGVNAGRRG